MRLRHELRRWAGGRRLLELARRRHDLKVLALKPWFVDGSEAVGDELRVLATEGAAETLRLRSTILREPAARDQVYETMAESAPGHVTVVPEAHLFESPGAVLTSRRRVLTENLHGRRKAILSIGAGSLPLRTFMPTSERLNEVFVLLGPFSYNYFHWMTEQLPRVADYLERSALGFPAARLLVPRWLNTWQHRSLELLGVEDRELVRLATPHARAQSALLSSHPGYQRDFLPATRYRTQWLRERLLAAVGVGLTPPSRRLFISRRDSSSPHRVANEEEIGRELSRYGFEQVVLSQISLDEQIRSFAAASFVVATHGAGLTNLMFATAPRVLEVVPGGAFRADFCALGRHVGAEYLLAEAPMGSDGRSVLSLDTLARALERLGIGD